jgi:hypothetical protein
MRGKCSKNVYLKELFSGTFTRTDPDLQWGISLRRTLISSSKKGEAAWDRALPAVTCHYSNKGTGASFVDTNSSNGQSSKCVLSYTDQNSLEQLGNSFEHSVANNKHKLRN